MLNKFNINSNLVIPLEISRRKRATMEDSGSKIYCLSENDPHDDKRFNTK